MKTDSLLVFADLRLVTSAPLLRAFVDQCRNRTDLQIVAVCDCGRKAPLPLPFHRSIGTARHLAKRAFNRPAPSVSSATAPGIYEIARANRIPIIVPRDRNLNHPEFVEQLRSRWPSSLALVVGCIQIFGEELLGVFEMAVNYHDGYLPYYKGLRATAWSLYLGETQTGYTFHRITPGIDAGPILLQNLIPVPEGAGAQEIYRSKTARAARDAAEVLNRMASRYECSPQPGEGSYFSARDRDRISTVDEPSLLPAAEINRRLWAFEILNIRLRGTRYPVTALEEGGPVRRLSFKTSDGRTLTPRRFMFLPLWLYWIYDAVKRRRNNAR